MGSGTADISRLLSSFLFLLTFDIYLLWLGLNHFGQADIRYPILKGNLGVFGIDSRR